VGAGDFFQGVSKDRHIEKVFHPLLPIQLVEVSRHRIRQKDGVAAQELHIAQYGPSRRHTTKDRRIGSSSRGFDTLVNKGRHGAYGE